MISTSIYKVNGAKYGVSFGLDVGHTKREYPKTMVWRSAEIASGRIYLDD